MEKSSVSQEFPLVKAVYSFLQDNVSSLFSFPVWNKGRITCQRSHLKRILSGTDSTSDENRKDEFIALSNSPLSLPSTRTSTSNVNSQHENPNSETRTELVTSRV